MLYTIGYAGNDTVRFAAKELARYLEQMDASAEVAVLGGTVASAACIQLGVALPQAAGLPLVNNASLDDAVCIEIEACRGLITGTNPRSVLLAVYRFLRECGCEWTQPGPLGEHIPQKRLETLRAHVAESASSRHRGVCIEGAVSFAHALAFTDWLPKVGMNSFFNQFFVPFEFYRRWYEHWDNPLLPPQALREEQVAAMVATQAVEIKKRGLIHHAVGHGWTCEPFGVHTVGWQKDKNPQPASFLNFCAEINGVRALHENTALNTNLCYSKPEVRFVMAQAIAAYAAAHPEVDCLHVWLADGWNNHCECPKCQTALPADFYVQVLNEVDALLARQALDTRVVFLVYMDLLWPPQTQRLQNPGRFTLMFAPISRTYASAYGPAQPCATLPPYRRNRVQLPRSVDENLQFLQAWKQLCNTDSFAFEYYFMWQHYSDPGGIQLAQTIGEDIARLPEYDLNGMISCQTLRSFYPTGFGCWFMAQKLWRRELRFEEAAAAYFERLFSDSWSTVFAYLSRLSALLAPLLAPGAAVAEEAEKNEATGILKAASQLLAETTPWLQAQAGKAADEKSRYPWDLLLHHAPLTGLLADALAFARADNAPGLEETLAQINQLARESESRFHASLDVFEFQLTLHRSLVEKEMPYAGLPDD